MGVPHAALFGALSALLRFVPYLGALVAGHPEVFCVCVTGRHNQYELWPGFADVAKPGDALVLLLDERKEGAVHETAALLAPYFTSVTPGASAPLMRGSDTVTVRRVWTLAGYRGGWPVRAVP